MLKFGKIKEVNHATGMVRVSFDEDGLTSDWLQVNVGRTGQDKFYSMPSVGEHVSCMLDDNAEDGVVIGSVYDKANAPAGATTGENLASMVFGDGVTLTINRADGFVVLTCSGKVRLVVEGKSVELTSSGLAIVGDTTIDGNLAVDGAISATEGISANGDIASEGNITAKGNIIAGPPGATVSLRTHLHPTPAGPSSPPTPGT